MYHSKGRNFLTALVVLIIVCPQLVIRFTEAGGKGKVGHPPPPPQHSDHKHFQHQRHAFNVHQHGGDHDDGDGEVKKIYLLQPMAQPQPQLKGGGFMGPIQNHIHLGQKNHGPKHGHQAGWSANMIHGQHHQQQHHQMVGDEDVRPATKAAGSSEVKILPIVVIPPMAPMAPIQMAGGPQRMSFSPQFNNFLVSGERSKRHQHPHAGRGDTFADYGGSLGASMFKENLAAIRSRSSRGRSPPAGSSNEFHGDSIQLSTATRTPRVRSDFDYNDFDYDNLPASSQTRHLEEQVLAKRRHQYRMAAPAAGRLQRRHQRQLASDLYRAKSIRDILDTQRGLSRYDDYDQPPANEQQFDFNSADTSGPARAYRSTGSLEAELGDSLPASGRHSGGGGALLTQRGTQPSFEISLDELGSQLAAADTAQQQQAARQPARAGASNQQDLSALHYDWTELASGSDRSTRVVKQPALASHLAGSATDSRPLSERELLESFVADDDEWRFDSIKSVAHVAANETMTPPDKLDPSKARVQLFSLKNNTSSNTTKPVH